MDKSSSLILIVDDNLQNLKVLGNTIKEEGWPLAVASSGKQALDFLKKRKPSLILLDIMMPEMDGYEVCEQIKENPDTCEIPIIFLTAKNDSESVVKGFDVGAVDYVSKPFNAQELLSRVNTHLELQYSKQQLQEKNESQKELLHVLCHDLANPVGAILSFTDLLLDKPDDVIELGNYIKISAESGMEIINLIRKMRAFEEKDIETYKVNLKNMVDQSYFMLQGKLIEKNIALEIDVPKEIEVVAEEVSLKSSVINNLLTNAIKFSEPGSTIQIEVEREAKLVKLYVKDNGIGIPDYLCKDLFDITKSTSRPGTNEESGTGFGMPLVKKFMQRYGGTIDISSRSIEENPEDHGTDITLTFLTEESDLDTE